MPPFLRKFIRSREVGLTLFAAVIGVIAAGFVALLSAAASICHQLFFQLQPGGQLSGLAQFDNPFIPMAGGVLLCVLAWLGVRLGRTAVVDPIEANALYGGRMSFRDSMLLTLQTLVSNGFGASVGMEAGYTQLGSGAASSLGAMLRLRREDLRVAVGCGAAGAIAAAFNGPLTGAFYAFELVLAQYAVGYVAPIMAASITAMFTMNVLGGAPFALHVHIDRPVVAGDIPWFMLLGLACAAIGIVWMRMLPLAERALSLTRAPRMFHPIIGGLIVGELATLSPQVLAGGHGALEFDLMVTASLSTLAMLALLKILATTISLGSGFRGGLFFASLFVGALIGRAVALGIASAEPTLAIDTMAFSLVGMAALASSVIGAPLTMSFLVMETTSDYGLTGAVLAASITSSLLTRELFGYSFSTWRFHLRGESVRSARDVGWMRDLTVGKIMRTEPPSARANLTVGEFERLYPLGSHSRVALIDDVGQFCGIVVVAEAHVAGLDQNAAILSLARTSPPLTPTMSIKDAMRAFDRTEADVLAVVDAPGSRKLVGTLKEAYAVRRYSDEMEKTQQFGL